MYSLDYLIETFMGHTEQSRKQQIRDKIKFYEENPGEPLPKHMVNDFNLPEALASICTEIKYIRDRNCNSFTLPDYPRCSCSTHGKCQFHQAS